MPEKYGAKRDGKTITDATMALNSATLTSASAPFTPADVGKAISVTGAGLTVNGNQLATTIVGYTDASTVTLGAQAAVAVSGTLADWGTDDTAAIKQAIAAAVAAGQADGSYYAEVQFSAGTYQVTGALDTSQQGRAQIPLPNVPTSSQKVTLMLKGVGDASALWDFNKMLTSGAVIRSNLNTGYDATYGSPSVLGGPTKEQVGTSASANLLVVLDGLSVITPRNSSAGGLDFQNVAEVNIGTLSLNGSVIPQGFTTVPTRGGFGLRMPLYWGENNSNIRRLAVIGYTYGFIPGEHTSVDSAVLFYCQYGVCPVVGNHAIRFGYLVTEGCSFHLSATLASSQVRLDVQQWDTEDVTVATTYHLHDPANLIRGAADFHCYSNSRTPNWGAPPLVSGGGKFSLINRSQPQGNVAAPAVPATTAALTNPFWRDAAVTVSGGTVSAIAVDGVAVGVTSGAVIVPSGKTITLTYSAAPSWVWTLL